MSPRLVRRINVELPGGRLQHTLTQRIESVMVESKDEALLGVKGLRRRLAAVQHHLTGAWGRGRGNGSLFSPCRAAVTPQQSSRGAQVARRCCPHPAAVCQTAMPRQLPLSHPQGINPHPARSPSQEGRNRSSWAPIQAWKAGHSLRPVCSGWPKAVAE